MSTVALRARRLPAVLALAVGAIVVAAILAGVDLGGSHARASSVVPTSLARVVRADVVERQQVGGTLGYNGSYSVVNGPTAAVVTWLPTAGAVVARGGTLYELNREPVPLLYGDRPTYRDFSFGMSAGPDVLALERNLRALGYAVHPSERFDIDTLAAVEQWQRSLGVQPTGTLTLGSVVFLPGRIRIANEVALVGSPVQPAAPILTATDTRPAVLVSLDPSSVSQLRAGDSVIVTMPDGSSADGRVSDIGRVASVPAQSQNGGGQPATPTIPVTIRLLASSTTGALDQAPVQVAITTQAARNVLAVPVSALLALPGGGYAVDVRDGALTRSVPVTTGLFDDVAGRVQVSGAGLAAGMQVEVPTR
ncbi:MAG TPA: peptidoglycan-binding protein [Gaiellaceae bacterium]|nr:peptidoglycan-binding protein [Gaiellaceae bacterium]